MWQAFKRVAPIVFLGVAPVAVLVIGVLTAVHQKNLGIDFRGELYPESKLVLEGRNPFPAPHADLAGGVNRIYPIPAALLASPLTLLPAGAAAVVFVAVLLAALAGTVRLLGVTDWRIYGAVALWPGSIAALQTGNVTILLGLLVALAWRYRDHRIAPGLAIGAAIGLKLFLWPLLFWLLAVRRYRAAAAGAAVSAASVLLVLPFTSLTGYLHLMDNLGNTFGPESYNLVGLLVRPGVASLATAKLVADCAGTLVLALAYRRRSLPLGIAASFVLSPIVWLHYFVLLLIPLGITRPRLSAAWLLPLALWGCSGTAGQIRTWMIVVALVVLAAVTVIAERRRGRQLLGGGAPGPARGSAGERRAESASTPTAAATP